MEQKYISHSALKNFVEVHHLSNRFSIIQFRATVTLITEKNKIEREELNVGVTFDGYENYGTLTLLESHLDPKLYPTVFNARWQKIMHIDEVYLLIEDTHPTIGKYSVKIVPLHKLSD